jgi:shikimate dehydrogenase
MPRLAVVGQPITHSRSPAMHQAALAALGLDREWSYEAIELAPDEFAARVRAMPAEGFRGINVTVPHKRAAIRLADRASATAQAIGAANTLSFTGEGIEADNTDAQGLIDALPFPPAGKRALVLGAGGSARACAWALREAGADVAIWNRTRSRAAELAAELDLTALGVSPSGDGGSTDGGLSACTYGLIVNATTVGMASANAASGGQEDPLAELKALPLDAESVGEGNVVVDLVYGSFTTPLVQVARERGATVVEGLEVLVRQGALSLRLWTGLDPPLDVMRKAAREA